MSRPSIAPEKQELIYVLARRGVSGPQIARDLGVSTRTVYRYLDRLGGVPRPFDAEYDARYLTHHERYEIARLRDGGWSLREIGCVLVNVPATLADATGT